MRQARRLEAAFPALLALVTALSCASGPDTGATPAAPVSAVEEPLAAEAQASAARPAPEGSAGTAIQTAEPAELSQGREERAAIESAIVFGSPASISRALGLIASASHLKGGEAAAYRALAEGVEAIAYSKDPRMPGARAGAPPASSAPAAPPAPAAAPDTPPALSAALSLLEGARAGKALPVPPEAAGTALGELMPALVLFAGSSREVARRASEALDRFARLGSTSILPDLALGLDAERQKQVEEALSRYAAALDDAPDAWPAALGSSRVLLALGRPEQALAILEALEGRLGSSLAFDRPYAMALVENGRYAEANPLVARVLTADPQDSDFVLIRARLLVRDRLYQQALPLLDAYGTVDAANRRYLILRSQASEGLKNRDEALRWARRGMGVYPDDPELLSAAARILYSGTGSGKEEARTLAQRAAALLGEEWTGSPADRAARRMASVEAVRLLASDAASRYEWAAAADYLDAAMAAAPYEDRQLAATILRKARRYPAALDYAADWYRGQPDSEAAAEAYLRALIDSGDGASAQDLVARLLPANHSNVFRSVLFYLQSRLQKSDEAALPLLRSALMENADNPEALAALSDIHVRRKDYAKARFYLKQALALAPGDPELARRQAELDKATQ